MFLTATEQQVEQDLLLDVGQDAAVAVVQVQLDDTQTTHRLDLICHHFQLRRESAEAIISVFSVPHSHSGARARERLLPLGVSA